MATTNTGLPYDKYGIREILDVSFTNLKSGAQELFLDTLKTSNITNKVTTTFATGGKGDPQIMAWDSARTAQLVVQDALLSSQSLAALAGSIASVGSAEVLARETPTVSSGAVTIQHTPVSGTVNVYSVTTNGALGSSLNATVSGTVVTITATPAPADGTQVMVYYQRTLTNASTVTINSDTFPGYYAVDGDGVGRDEATGYDYPLHVHIPKAKLQGNFTLTFAPNGNPTVLDFTLDILRDNLKSDMINIVRWDEADQV